MRYIHATTGAAIALVVFVILTFVIPGAGPSNEVEIVLTVSTFLFAILAGFFISRLNSRHDEIRQIVGREDATMLSFYKTAETCNKKLAEELKGILDNYYVIIYDFKMSDYPYKQTSKYFIQLWDTVNKYHNKKKDESAYSQLLYLLAEIEEARNSAAVVVTERMTVGQWWALIVLAAVVLFSIFYLKSSAIYSHVITVLLSTVLVLVLLIMRDLENLFLGGQTVLEESGEEIFEFIGKRRYYQSALLKERYNTIPKDVKEYRLGLHKPGAKKFKIKVIKR